MLKKLLIGCGVVAALGILLIIGGTWMLARWAKSKFPDTARIEAVQEDLKLRFGDRDAFVPAASLDPARLEIFLSVRDSLVSRGAVVGDDIEHLARIGKQAEDKERSTLDRILQGTSVARGGIALATRAMDYTRRRGQALLDAGMGDGEYGYLFALTYFSYLEWNPATADTHVARDRIHSDTGAAQTWWAMRETFIRQLRNLEAALVAASARDRETGDLLVLVRAEIADTAGGGRFPLAGRVPPAWRAVLDRARGRIETTRPQSADELFLDRMEYHNRGVRFEFDRDKQDGKRAPPTTSSGGATPTLIDSTSTGKRSGP